MRNRGLLEDDEIRRVRNVRIGVGGLGGCGGNHLVALTRMGFEHFSIADPDIFEAANLNRQAGATMSTLGQRKVDVMQRMVLDINPRAKVVVYPEGLTSENVGDFAAETDIGINAIDFFRIDLYAPYHDAYRRQGKRSVVGASPFAFGAAVTVLGPETPAFGDAFEISADDPLERQLARFCERMTPAGFARRYLRPGVNEIRAPLPETCISSSAATLHLCTALTAAEVLFMVTERRAPTLAPRVLQVDLCEQALAGGNSVGRP